MLRRIIVQSVRVRGGRTIVALGALTLAATLITTILAIYSDLERKLATEFRSYGANIVISSGNGGALPADAELRTVDVLGQRAQVVPIAVAVASAKRKDGTSAEVVVVGADLKKLHRLNSWWKVQEQGEGMLAGKHAAEALDVASPMEFAGRQISWTIGAVIESGSSDDDRVYMERSQFERLTGVKPNAIQVSFTGSAAETRAAVMRLQSAFPADGVAVNPVRQIVESEGRVIGKTRAMMLGCGLLIVITVALCVTSTLMASVLERRRDFALMKALGASQQVVSSLFASEAMLVAIVAGVMGFAIGAGLAELISRRSFHASIVPTQMVFTTVLLSNVAIAFVACALPLFRLRGVQPAVILKGE
ncbi:MAG: FtsX-like permease family protein [Acidobacteriaceae bacterium]